MFPVRRSRKRMEGGFSPRRSCRARLPERPETRSRTVVSSGIGMGNAAANREQTQARDPGVSAADPARLAYVSFTGSMGARPSHVRNGRAATPGDYVAPRGTLPAYATELPH